LKKIVKQRSVLNKSKVNERKLNMILGSNLKIHGKKLLVLYEREKKKQITINM
jgi:hypothetical protein